MKFIYWFVWLLTKKCCPICGMVKHNPGFVFNRSEYVEVPNMQPVQRNIFKECENRYHMPMPKPERCRHMTRVVTGTVFQCIKDHNHPGAHENSMVI